MYTTHLKADGEKIEKGSKEEDNIKREAGQLYREWKGKKKVECPFFLPALEFLFPESSVTVKLENKESRELMLFISSIVLGILLLGSLIFIAFILLRIKGKYGKCKVLGATAIPGGCEPRQNPSSSGVVQQWPTDPGPGELPMVERIFPACPAVVYPPAGRTRLCACVCACVCVRARACKCWGNEEGGVSMRTEWNQVDWERAKK